MSRRTRTWGVWALGVATFGLSAQAAARPPAAWRVCEVFPDAGECRGKQPTCTLCHDSTDPVSWNSFGLAVFENIGDRDLVDDMGPILMDVLELDSDGDGVDNAYELAVGTNPGDETDAWPYCEVDVERSDMGYETAYRRTFALFCGRSATYEEVSMLQEAEDKNAELHAALDECLASEWWTSDGLARLADEKIRPIAAVAPGAEIVIGEYDFDYQMYRYVMSGDRDVRDLLLADYHVDESLQKIEGTFPGVGGQPLQLDKRAGMITTQWFMVINTMFSPLPRTTAAQAYRAYLGYDIAKLQGIRPVSDEPLDIDNRGVAEADCAQCHSTLDPLSYAFAEYQGITGGDSGTWDPDRPADAIEGWNDPQSVLFQTEVGGVREWAELAAESDEFQRTVARDLFYYALGREPGPRELEGFTNVWRSLPDSGWSTNAMIHELVDLPVFGGEG